MYAKQLFPVFINYSTSVLKNIRPAVFLNCNESPNLDFVRYAARKGTRTAALATKKARKLKEAAKPQPIPKYLQRKVKVSIELERTRCTDENWLESQPIDNVYNMRLHRGKPYTVAEAIEMHRETHAPEMINNPSALIYANIELDLKLKKKDRYMDDFVGAITFPHEFVGSKQNKVIVICEKEDEQAMATDAGAVYAGSKALIKQILAGSVGSDEYDYLICHPDMYKEVNALRGILGKRFPNANNGLLRLDIVPAVKSFINAIDYKLKRSSKEPDFGWVDVSFGRLNMPTQHLEENLQHLLKKIEGYKPIGTDNILFIIRTLLWCEQSREKFKIPHWMYLPNYPENGVLREDVDQQVETNKS